MQHGPSAGLHAVGVTLTVPGPPLTLDEQKKAWNAFTKYCQRSGFSAVWRLELQRRGAVHWHLIMLGPWKDSPVSPASYDVFKHRWIPESMPEVERDLWGWGFVGSSCIPAMADAASKLRGRKCPARGPWAAALDVLGRLDYEVSPPQAHRLHVEGVKNGPKGGDTICNVFRSEIIGADRAAVVANPLHQSDGNGWHRYLLDHASKRKQEQIATGRGRHWGIINRRLWAAVDAVYSRQLKKKAWWQLCRILQRASRRRIHDPRVKPWGTRLGFRGSRGRIGKSEWFGMKRDTARLVDWLETEYPEFVKKLPGE
jgi:hypothetical protein